MVKTKMIKKQLAKIAAVVVLSFSTVFTAYAEPDTTKSTIVEITDSTFTCMRDMTKVDGFYVGNLQGDIAATVAVASSKTGGKYPAGSVIQLVPGEVMVKHSAGISPETNDWEFFELDVSPKGSKIKKRGFTDVVNRFGGNCLDCHVKAEPQWDMVCKTGHGCDPIPLTKDVLALLQKTDPRCIDNEKLNEQEVETLMQLKKAMAAMLQK